MTVDYVIVGLGTAGTPLARYLSEDLTTSVLVLEAGENHGSDPRTLAGNNNVDRTLAFSPRHSFNRSAIIANLSNEPTPGDIWTYSDGRGWGGGSAHNFTLAVRSSPDAYNAWGAISAQWAYNNLLPIMKFMETYLPNGTVANPAQRGFSGPLFIKQIAPPFPNVGLYTAIMGAANAPFVSDYNDPSLGDVGSATPQRYATPADQRSFAQSAFLPDEQIVTNDGQGVGGRLLTIISKATALEVVIEDTEDGLTATGVRYFLANDPDTVLLVRARKKVILSAGTIATAQLLQLSGIGNPVDLEDLGIPVKVENPNVGANVQNHYGPTALIPNGTPAPGAPVHAYLDGSGVNLTQPNDRVRRIQMIVQANNNSNIPRAVRNVIGINTVPSSQFVFFNLIPNRLGTIKIVSTDPLVQPEIRFRFYQDVASKTDLDLAVDMFKIAANISLAWTGMMPLYPPQSHYPAPYGPAPNDNLLRQDAQDVYNITYHASGSCRMGSSIADGVVDGNLDVFGVRNLSCCDNSVQPQITKGNTSYPAYVLGLKKAQIEGATVPF